MNEYKIDGYQRIEKDAESIPMSGAIAVLKNGNHGVVEQFDYSSFSLPEYSIGFSNLCEGRVQWDEIDYFLIPEQCIPEQRIPQRMPDKPGLWEDRLRDVWFAGFSHRSDGLMMQRIGIRQWDMTIKWTTDYDSQYHVRELTGRAPFKPARDLVEPVGIPGTSDDGSAR